MFSLDSKNKIAYRETCYVKQKDTQMKKNLIILAVIVALLSWGVVSCMNGLVRMDENVTAKWSQVLNQYQRRSDLIPNLVSTVKGYAAHEQETLEGVVEARAKATSMTLSTRDLSNVAAMQQFQEAQNSLTSALSRLMVVVEKYPELQANENFMALQSQLEGTENRIAVARRDYIEAIQIFNSKIRTIPTSWVARIFTDLEPKASFDIAEEAKTTPKVEF